MRAGDSPDQTLGRILELLGPVLRGVRPQLLLVQGDTTTALAGALAGFYHGVPVGPVEAGLRSGDAPSPYPEGVHPRLTPPAASYHFAATERNRRTLVAEGVAPRSVFLTGNPVVDALQWVLPRLAIGPHISDVLRRTEGLRRVILTAHRRENFGA